jgi:hypothetical protein
MKHHGFYRVFKFVCIVIGQRFRLCGFNSLLH